MSERGDRGGRGGASARGHGRGGLGRGGLGRDGQGRGQPGGKGDGGKGGGQGRGQPGRGKGRGGKGSAKASTKAPSQRMLRVAELIRHKLSQMLVRSEIHDDVIASHVITISEVRMSPDMKLATAYVMPLGGQDVKPVIEALNSHKKFIRSAIAHEVNLKYAPDVRFRDDESFEEATRIDRLLDSPHVRQDTKPNLKTRDAVDADDELSDEEPSKHED